MAIVMHPFPEVLPEVMAAPAHGQGGPYRRSSKPCVTSGIVSRTTRVSTRADAGPRAIRSSMSATASGGP